MIQNKDQYEITKKWRDEFKGLLLLVDNIDELSSLEKEIYTNAYKSQIETLEKEMQEYEQNNSHRI
jgi:hypothetical protein